MDAKPVRPVRQLLAPVPHNENVPLNQPVQKVKPAHGAQGVHQYLKTAAFKGPAKRTAFGDVSNLAGNIVNHKLPGKGLGKNAANVKFVPHVDIKENGSSSNEAFHRPVQRPTQGSKPTTSSHAPANIGLSSHPQLKAPAVDYHFQPLIKQTVAKKATIVYNDEVGQQKPQALSRHFKSQPSLKAEPPILRRTQSKHIDHVDEFDRNEDNNPEAPYKDAVGELPSEDVHFPVEISAAHTKHEVPGPIGPPITVNMAPLQPLNAFGHPLYSAPLSAEPTDYWPEEGDDEDVDEDLYDEQGYTTAHSFRSHGDNTTGATTVLAPKFTEDVQCELANAKSLVESTMLQQDIDEEEWDVSMVAEYGEDIFDYMRELEIRMMPNPHYMDEQLEIQWSMRSVLMDWLVQVHTRFSLLPETLFLTVNYIDRFLSKKIVSLGKLQLVGATAIFVAAKYEEINCPSVQEIVYMVDSGYSVDEILKAERFMLSMLQFELGWPGPMSFLRRISKADDYELETRTLAKYFLEVTIMDERFVSSQPSFLAAGAHCLARLMLKKGDWSPAHVHYSGYTLGQLQGLVATILECCQAPEEHHGAVFEKYSHSRFKKASRFVELEVANGFSLPFHHSVPRLSLTGSVDKEPAPIRYPPPDTNNSMLIPIQS